MKGTNFIPKIKALRDIHGVCVTNNVYELNDLKSLFPYIDFNNTDYFQPVYDTKYDVGDNVRFIGRVTFANKNLSNKITYVVKKVIPQIKNGLLYIYYEIADANNNSQTYTVTEVEIEKAQEKWILSFSQAHNTDMPGVHKLDFYAWEHKIKGTWKEIFVFNKFEDAVKIACMFKNHTIAEIWEATENYYK